MGRAHLMRKRKPLPSVIKECQADASSVAAYLAWTELATYPQTEHPEVLRLLRKLRRLLVIVSGTCKQLVRLDSVERKVGK